MIQIKDRNLKIDWSKINQKGISLYSGGKFTLMGYILCHCYGIIGNLLHSTTLPLYVSNALDEELELLTEFKGIGNFRHLMHTEYCGRIYRSKTIHDELAILREEFTLT